jgi:3-deoxy-D-manno-octulosonic-acid transferase
MEPAGMGLPVAIGPVHQNSAEALEMVRTGGAVAAADAGGIEAALERWLSDPAARAAAGQKALRVVEGNAGATGRTLELIRGLLPQT